MLICVTPSEKEQLFQWALFYEGMRANNRPVLFRIYPSGGHGWAVRLSSEYRSQVLEDLSDWLKNKRLE